MHRARPTSSGFTIVELLIGMAIIAILAGVILTAVRNVQENAIEGRAIAELREFGNAIERYAVENGAYPPPSTAPGVLPAGAEDYFPEDAFTDGPWNGNYAWETWQTLAGDTVGQVTLHFCPAGATDVEECSFPRLSWADDFTIGSTAYRCLVGECQAGESLPPAHPAHCVNCED